MRPLIFICLLTLANAAFSQTNPTAAFSSTPPCLGGLSIFTDGSVAPPGDPIATWQWLFPGGTPSNSTSQNSTTTYPTAGTHSVTLIVTTSNGYSDTIVQLTLVYSPPAALFSGGGNGCAPVCVSNWIDQSTSMDGAITSWLWNFPGVSPSTSVGMNPGTVCFNTPGAYGATLIVTTVYGCKDTFASGTLVNVYAWPSASFTYTVSGGTISCTNTSSGGTNSGWNFGDGTPTDTNASPVHTYAFGNAYNVCLTVQNQYGCWDTICQMITIASVGEHGWENLIDIYPNPTNGIIYLQSFTALTFIEVHNVLGEAVMEDSGGTNYRMDLSYLANGMYILRITCREGILHRKIIKK